MLPQLTLILGLCCVAFSITRAIAASVDERPIWPAGTLGLCGLALLAVAWTIDPDGLTVADVPLAVVELIRFALD